MHYSLGTFRLPSPGLRAKANWSNSRAARTWTRMESGVGGEDLDLVGQTLERGAGEGAQPAGEGDDAVLELGGVVGALLRGVGDVHAERGAAGGGDGPFVLQRQALAGVVEDAGVEAHHGGEIGLFDGAVASAVMAVEVGPDLIQQDAIRVRVLGAG